MSKLNQFIGFGSKLFLAIALCAVGFQNTIAQEAKHQQRNEESILSASQCGQFSLRNAEYFRISSRAGSLVTADFNNDAIPDVVAMMPDTNSIAVALGDNQTGFSTSRDFVVGVSPQEAAVGDFNHDGELDLAVTSALDDFVTIMHGDGLGNFESGESYSVGGAPRGVQTKDFNRDGWLDLVVANTEAPNLGLSILLGGPNGMSPANPGIIVLSDSPKAVKTADFNNDGNTDIITIGHNSGGDSGFLSTVRIFQGNGAGGFAETTAFPFGESYTVETADFNTDGFADFAVFGQPDLKVRIYLNNRNGGFNMPLEIPTSGYSALQSTFVAGDLNGDGIIDLALAGFFMINDGNANFTIRSESEVVNDRFVLADFNGDGFIDQASPTDISDPYSSPQLANFAVAYGLGDARFIVPSFIGNVGGATQMLTGDFNNDGRDDIVSGALSSYNHIRIAFQNADGSFNVQGVSVHGGVANSFTIVAAADFNKDGNLDLATNITWAGSVSILTNNGSGEFTLSGVRLGDVGFSFSLQYFQPGDFNNDGYPDIIAVSPTSYSVALNNGSSGGFTSLGTVNIGNSFEGTKRIVVGDFDNDGKKDFAVARNNGLHQFRGNGNGTFALTKLYQMPLSVAMARGADVNNDNRTDIVVSTGGNFMIGGAGMSVFIAGETGIFTQTNFTLAGGPGDVLFADVNNDSFKDFVVLNSPNNHLTVFHGNGAGIFAPQTPFVVSTMPTSGTFGNFNQDQKPDLVLSGQFAGIARLFYNTTPLAPCLSISNTSIAEGNSGSTNAKFTVSLSAPSTESVTVNYRVVGRSAALNSDFNNQTGTLTFAPGTLTQTVNVPVVGDVKDEIDETFQLVLTNPSGASLSGNIGIGTIVDDDATPSVRINDVSMLEGTGATPTQMLFTLSLSAPTGRKAKVGYSLLDGTAAQSTSDFAPNGKTAVFGEDQTSQQIVVSILADAYVEPDETFRVKLAAPSNLTIADDEATATILNDDLGGVVQFSVASQTASETDDTVTINVTRTGGAAAGILVMYSTADGTAIANRDYLPSIGKIIFGAGETTKTFTVPILDDAFDEPDSETVSLSLSNISGGAVLGTQSSSLLNISDNDPTPSLTIAGVSIGEGNSGISTANFTVRLIAVSGQAVTVNFATVDGSATAPVDYASHSGTLVFAPGETVKTVSVTVNGDTQIEPNETFFLTLSAPINAVLQNAQVAATITNDDLVGQRAPFDFDGDGKTDTSVFRPSNGVWYFTNSSNNSFRASQFGLDGDIPAPEDYDGDNITDIAVFRPANGTWYMLRSSDNSFVAVQFGANGDVPAAADYDGDAMADFTVFRPSNGVWYRLNSGSNNSFYAAQFGLNGDVPIQGDYDGDSKADLAVWRPSNGVWYRINSSNQAFSAVGFGLNGDIPTPGDFDGDSRTDQAVFRPLDGTWYLQQSSSGFQAIGFGLNGDIPLIGDFDGDGKSDAGVFRPSNSTWYVDQTSAGILITKFGASGDIPIPGALVP